MRVKSRISLSAFCWRFRIRGGDELEMYENANLTKVPLADKHIRIYTGYLEYDLQLPFNNFTRMVLVYYDRAPSQYTAHFYLLLSIIEGIHNAVGYGRCLQLFLCQSSKVEVYHI